MPIEADGPNRDREAGRDREAARDRTAIGWLRRAIAKRLARRPVPLAPPHGLISFSFDDVPLSAAEAGAAIIEEAGGRASFFVCAEFADGAEGEMAPYADWAVLKRLAARGHEIGSHGFHHRNVALMTRARIAAMRQRNDEAFAEQGLPPARSFAFPFGDVSARAKAVLGPRFAVLRGVQPGLMRRGGDLNCAHAVAIEGESAVAAAREWIEQAAREQAWLILFSHDVRDTPSAWGLSPESLRAIVGMARAGGLEIVTVEQGGRRLGSA